MRIVEGRDGKLFLGELIDLSKDISRSENMEEEWRRLEKDNLPRDILTGDYEFRDFIFGVLPLPEGNRAYIISQVCEGRILHYRRKKQQEFSHEFIMTRFWKDDNGVWLRIEGYCPESGQYLCRKGPGKEMPYRDWFTGRENATIPPEA